MSWKKHDGKVKGMGGNKQFKADLVMLIITMFWGSSYLFTRFGLESIEEFNLIALRFCIAFVLAGAVFYKRFKLIDLQTVKYGFLLGTILFSLVAVVTIGVKFTSISNAGFLFSLAVVFVPIFMAVFLKKQTEKKVVIGTVLSITGIALLTLNNGLMINPGDILVILGALFYSIYIIMTDTLTKHVDSVGLGILQLGFSGAWGLVFSFIFETPHLPETKVSWISILALSVLCSAVGFIGQTAAQKYTTPAHTGLIFSLEPVFAAFFALIFAGEILPVKGYAGATLVLMGVIIAKLDFKKPDFTKRLNDKVYKTGV